MQPQKMTSAKTGQNLCRSICLAAIFVAGLVFLCSCSPTGNTDKGSSAYLGDYSYASPISAMVYEDMDEEGKGIQYREVTDYTKLIAYSQTPVCLYFFSSQDLDTSGVTAAVEQLAETYSNQIMFVSIDANQETEISTHFHINKLPDFVILDKGSLKASFASNGGESWTISDLEEWIVSQSGIS